MEKKGGNKLGNSHVGGKAKYQCSICLKSIGSRLSMKEHLWAHEGLKPYTCLDCDQCYSYNSNLNYHCHKFDHEKGQFLDPDDSQNWSKLGRKKKTMIPPLVKAKQGWKPPNTQTKPNKHVDAAKNSSLTRRKRGRPPRHKKTVSISQTKEMESQKSDEDMNVTQLTGFSFRCGLCRKEFKNIADAVRHKSTHIDNFKCRYCDKTVKTKVGLILHERIHSNNVQKSGRTKKASSLSSLTGHHQLQSKGTRAQTRTSGNNFKCDICGSDFKSYKSLIAHRAFHFKKSFLCRKCKQRFLTFQLLCSHIKLCEGKEPKLKKEMSALAQTSPVKSYLRNLPERKANRANQQVKEQTEQTKVPTKLMLKRKLECKVSGENFDYDLELHKQEKRYKSGKRNITPAQPSNKKMLRNRGVTNTHETSESEEIEVEIETPVTKSFACDICEKMFVTKLVLERHYRIHTGESAYQCEYCHKGFSHKTSYERHMSQKWDDNLHENKNPRPRTRSLSDMSKHSDESTVHSNDSTVSTIGSDTEWEAETELDGSTTDHSFDSINESEIDDINPVPIGIIQNVNTVSQNKLIPVGIRLEEDMLDGKNTVLGRDRDSTVSTGSELVSKAEQLYSETVTSSQATKLIQHQDKLMTKSQGTVLEANQERHPHPHPHPHPSSDTIASSQGCELLQNLETPSQLSSGIAISSEGTRLMQNEERLKCLSSGTVSLQYTGGLPHLSSKTIARKEGNESIPDSEAQSSGTASKGNHSITHPERLPQLPESTSGSMKTVLMPDQNRFPNLSADNIPGILSNQQFSGTATTNPSIQWIPINFFSRAIEKSRGNVLVQTPEELQQFLSGTAKTDLRTKLVSNPEIPPRLPLGTTVTLRGPNPASIHPAFPRHLFQTTSTAISTIALANPEIVSHLTPEVAVIEPQKSASQHNPTEPRTITGQVEELSTVIKVKTEDTDDGARGRNLSSATLFCDMDTNQDVDFTDMESTGEFQEYTLIPSKYKHTASECVGVQRTEDVKQECVISPGYDAPDPASKFIQSDYSQKVKTEPGLCIPLSFPDGLGLEKDEPISIDSDSETDVEKERPGNISEMITNASGILARSKLASRERGVLSVGLVYSKKKTTGNKDVPIGIVHHQPQESTEVTIPCPTIKQEFKTSDDIVSNDNIIILD